MITTLAMKAELALGTIPVLAEKVDNPLKGVSPNLEVFGVKFTNAISLILGGAWALALVVAVFFMIKNGASWAAARQRGMSDDMEDGATGLKRSALAFALIAALGVIVGAILNLIGML
ncbi:hypothetical protein [Galactobacter valiniphilus]|uniref:hypothetical protein n=1 Tax=Galactobacter valiniphilus TaxID=2676122 RepID=UPI00373589C9